MRTFKCYCGNTLYFENSQCTACGRRLGFLPDVSTLSALEPSADGHWHALAPSAGGGEYRQCLNYSREQVCNWMVRRDDPAGFCLACRLNEVIPDLSQPDYRTYWHKIEMAKRRLLYTLYQLGLPVQGREQDAQRGLAFAFLADPDATSEFSDSFAEGSPPILTGHLNGLITINIAEADDSARARMRERMNERYRTLLGHLRHEIAHYYWDRLIRATDWLPAFRERFGDERQNYNAALARYYNDGPPFNWHTSYVSAYAASHPWEDWAETWAHYLHMTDTIETAACYGFTSAPVAVHDTVLDDKQLDQVLDEMVRITLAVNDLNRGMGLPDAYPFVLSPPARAKLRFIRKLIESVATEDAMRPSGAPTIATD